MEDDFPYLSVEDRIEFPRPTRRNTASPVCMGGNLSPGVLLSAYEQGLYPWYSQDDPILWWSPDPRWILEPGDLHIGKRLKRYLRAMNATVSVDADFERIIGLCGRLREKSGTWIDERIVTGYSELHRLGYAHSIEIRRNEQIIGGLYGVQIGAVFAGESMVSIEKHASKAALTALCVFARDAGFSLIDCQMETPYLVSMGARPVARSDYLSRLKEGLESGFPGQWPSTTNGTLRVEELLSVFERRTAHKLPQDRHVGDEFAGYRKEQLE